MNMSISAVNYSLVRTMLQSINLANSLPSRSTALLTSRANLKSFIPRNSGTKCQRRHETETIPSDTSKYYRRWELVMMLSLDEVD